MSLNRRRLLAGSAAALALPHLAGCGTPLPLGRIPPPNDDAARRLRDSAEAHGLAAYRSITDIAIAYGGQWRPFIGRIQPVVVDEGYRGPSEERLMPQRGIVAQAYRGPSGTKQVSWQREGARVAVWYDGRPASDAGVLDASALVAEGYGLFLLGPLWLAERGFDCALNGTARVHGRLCDIVEVAMKPGLGRVALDRVAVYVDRDDAVTRRVRFTLEGYSGTRGAVAEVDTFEHRRLHGVLWPTRSYEEVVHPLRIPAHDWYVTGLDVNRGYGAEALAGATFTGAAAAPARRLPTA